MTGGTRGIGEAISLALKEQGRTVIANYAGNDERAKEFSARTGITAMKWDVGDHEAPSSGAPPVHRAAASATATEDWQRTARA